MVSQTLNDEVLTEIAEAVSEGVEAENLVEIEQAISSDVPLGVEQVQRRNGQVVNQGFTYIVPPTEAAQWIAAWRMEVGRDGVEYGRPTKLNIQQLGLHLSRRRMDGGRLFVIKMPERVVPAGRFQCFAVPDQCVKKLSSKGMLLDHIENFHPTAAKHLHEELEVIRKSMNKDNAALQNTIEQLASTPDDPWVAAPTEARAASEAAVAHIDTKMGEELPDPMSVPDMRCGLCPWPQGSEKWEGRTPSQQALKMHIFAKHKEEV
jgi:hypothetical protein